VPIARPRPGMRGRIMSGRVWSPGKSPRVPFRRGPQARGRLAGVNDSEPLLMPREMHILGRVVVQGDRGWPLRSGRRPPGTCTGRAGTAAPGV
jgi:hypothetical protein